MKRSEAYTTAFRALQKLLKEEDMNAVQIAYSQVVEDEIRQNFINYHNIKESTKTCALRLIGKQCTSSHSDCIPPGLKECTLWLKNGNPFMFVAQQCGLGHEELIELIDYCKKYGLKMRITGEKQWHNPGNVFTVILTADKDEGISI